MKGIKDYKVDIKIISPEKDNCFFGYYDLNAYDSTGNTHLCYRTKFIDRIPTDKDILELGYVKNNIFTKFAETTAWNFQQGAMLQYKTGSDDTVFYNIRQENGYKTVMHNILSGEKQYYNMPSACISPDGRYGLSINFPRIFDFRKGYGYYGIEDAFKNENRPEKDGIFLIDFQTGSIKLIISYEDIYKAFPSDVTENEKLIVNHITFNTTSDRFLFLLRNFPGKEAKEWGTTLITSDLDGNMNMVLENKFFSHYAWKNDKEIVAFCSPYDKAGLFLIKDIENSVVELKSPYPHGPYGGDIHCIYSPDKRYILGDGYPDTDGYRPLFLYDTHTENIVQLLKSASLMDSNWDVRCDLHARFNRTGNKVSFDSVHNGTRQICEINISELLSV